MNEQSGSEAYNKRRSLGSGGVPTAPRAHRQNGGKRSLLDRMGGPPLNPQAAEFGPGRRNSKFDTFHSKTVSFRLSFFLSSQTLAPRGCP